MIDAGLRDPSDIIEANYGHFDFEGEVKGSSQTMPEETFSVEISENVSNKAEISKDSVIFISYSNETNKYNIYIMNTDGSNRKKLLELDEQVYTSEIKWSPDKKYIAFGSMSDIYIMNSDGSNLKNLTNSYGTYLSFAWSPDSSFILYEFIEGEFPASSEDVAEKSEIYSINIDDSNRNRLTKNEICDFDPALSPDGKSIVFASFEGPANDIYIMDSDGSNQRNLTNSSYSNEFSPIWSYDGKYIYYGNPSCICIMKADGSNQKDLNGYAMWKFEPSPDGNYIGYVDYSIDNSEIYIMNSDGSNQKNLTNSPAINDDFVWSPDSKSIMFISINGIKSEIYKINVDGSNLVKLTNESSEYITGFDWK